MSTEDIQQTMVNGELVYEQEFDKLWAPQMPAKKETTIVMPRVKVRAPKGYFTINKYYPPKNIERKDYLNALFEEMYGENWIEYGPCKSKRVVHRERIDSLNFYHPDLLRALENLFVYYGDGTLYIVNGFRSPLELGAEAHSLGIAIDIEAKNNAESYRIMNAAYMAGFPTIIPGGDFPNGQGYIHLDLAPKAAYNYGMGVYDGPWS